MNENKQQITRGKILSIDENKITMLCNNNEILSGEIAQSYFKPDKGEKVYLCGYKPNEFVIRNVVIKPPVAD